MKITYNDMFDNISDAAFEILDENDIFNDEIEEMFSSDKTCKDVTDMIHKQKSVRKRHFTFKGVLLAAALTVLTVLASVITVARNNGAALIDDSNRDLVGKASEMTVHKIDKGETLVFQAQEYESELHRGKGQRISYFYIRDGVILRGNGQTGLNQTFELTAEKAGEYYICLLNASSDAISLKEGKVFIK